MSYKKQQSNSKKPSFSKPSTSSPPPNQTQQNTPPKCLLTDEHVHWYSIGSTLKDRNSTHPPDSPAILPAIVLTFRNLADTEMEKELLAYKTWRSKNASSDDAWVEKSARYNGGATLSDRIAAMVLLVNDSPVHRIDVIDQLLDLATKERRIANMVADAMRDLFVNNLIPNDRKLIPMTERPLNKYVNNTTTSLSPKIILLWRYEELLKQRYSMFINLLQTWLGSPLDTIKKFSLHTSIDLLTSLPENEATLLQMIVNKLGDPSKKSAASAGHQLRRLLMTHPAMTMVVCKEVRQLCMRVNLGDRGVYNCVIFLNQIAFVKDDERERNSSNSESGGGGGDGESGLAESLIKCYFKLFEIASTQRPTDTKNSPGEAGGMKSRLLSALLQGVNRAYPYLRNSNNNGSGVVGGLLEGEHVDALYRVVHTGSNGACVQGLMLLFNVVIGNQPLSKAKNKDNVSGKDSNSNETEAEKINQRAITRYYTAVYTTLSRVSLYTGKSLTLFYNLIYKSLKSDNNDTRVLVMCKRLLSVSMCVGGNVVGGAVFLVSMIVQFQSKQIAHASDVDGGMNGGMNGAMKGGLYDSIKTTHKTTFNTESTNNRNPESTLVHNTGTLWELSMTHFHYNPSVVKFTSSICEDGIVEYNGDPLRDFTVMPFLDRFAFKNPKNKQRLQKEFKLNESVSERKSGGRGMHVVGGVAVNDMKFLEEVEKGRVGVNEYFYAKFFKEREVRDGVKGVVRNPESSKTKDGCEAGDDILDADFGDIDEDPEEEAFAQALAEKFMEDHGNGKANFDDEDVDMEGWGDVNGDLDYGDDGEDGEGEEEEGLEDLELDLEGGGSDDDSVISDYYSDEEEAVKNKGKRIVRVNSDDEKEEEEGSDGDSESEESENEVNAFTYAADSDSDSDEEEEEEGDSENDDDNDDDADEQNDQNESNSEVESNSDSEDALPPTKKQTKTAKKPKTSKHSNSSISSFKEMTDSSVAVLQTDDFWAKRDAKAAAEKAAITASASAGVSEGGGSGGRKRKSRSKKT